MSEFPEATDRQIELMKDFWSHYGKPPHLRELNATLLKRDFLSLIARLEKLRNALYECEEYFDNYAAAGREEGTWVQNEEMKLLHAVRDALLGGADA